MRQGPEGYHEAKTSMERGALLTLDLFLEISIEGTDVYLAFGEVYNDLA